MPKSRTHRAAVALGASTIVASVALAQAGAAPPPVPDDARAAEAPSALTDAFAAAAERHDVPRDLLVALAYTVTRLDDHDARPSASGGYGVMHLIDNPETDTLGAAAALTGHDPAALRADTSANIDGAAAVLRAEADDLGLDRDDRDDLGSWYEATAGYSDFDDDAVARLEADAVFDALRGGFDVDVDGERISVPARDVDPDLGALTDVETLDQRFENQSDDYGPAHWVPAHGNGFQAADRPSSHAIDRVVIHTMQGSYAGSISWFQNPDAGVAAHYLIRSSDGDVTQMVRHKDIGWHANSFNSRSIGIEHEGYVDDASWYTEAMYRSSAALTRHLTDTYGIPRDRTHIVGHSEVPGATHTDPGPNWDWDRYMSYVNDGDDPDPEPGTPFTTWGSGVNVRADAYLDSPVVTALAGSTNVRVICQKQGSTVTYDGYTNDWWSRLSAQNGFVSNIFIDHPAQQLPGVPTC